MGSAAVQPGAPSRAGPSGSLLGCLPDLQTVRMVTHAGEEQTALGLQGSDAMDELRGNQTSLCWRSA